ncbi:MAG: LacI family DNA-binding transcriptional regulator [Armatimonadetes bacterium]|nr:LacI family DNA-binding transcriptional regulator [Armatimonadota bacterium]
MATLRDVARLSGVSPATVSHVLHHRTRNMSAETRERVLKAVRSLGYRPGSVPRGGSNQSTHTIGVFVWLDPEYPLRNTPYATNILDGVLSAAMGSGWNVTLLNVGAWDNAQAQLRRFADGRCDGFLLIGAPPTIGISTALRERGFPFVMINSGSEDTQSSSVDIDNFTAAREITTYLLGQGHRHIGFLIGEDQYENVNERQRGFEAAFADAGFPLAPDAVLRPGSYVLEQSRERLETMLTNRQKKLPSERITALLCGNDRLAEITAQMLAEQGIRVPEDISLAGFDDIRFAREMSPTLTTVRQPLYDLGARATAILLDQIGAESVSETPTKEFLPHSIVYRESVSRR